MTSRRPPTYIAGALVGLVIGIGAILALTLALLVLTAGAELVGWETTTGVVTTGVAVALVNTFRQRRLWRQHAERATSRNDR